MGEILPMAGKLKAIFSDVIRTMRRLFQEVMAAFFVALGVVGITSVVEEYRKYVSAPAEGVLRLTMSILFSTVMLAFGLHTFWKARKTR
jgi:prolipoprotein diacylglyceryltransferase